MNPVIPILEPAPFGLSQNEESSIANQVSSLGFSPIFLLSTQLRIVESLTPHEAFIPYYFVLTRNEELLTNSEENGLDSLMAKEFPWAHRISVKPAEIVRLMQNDAEHLSLWNVEYCPSICRAAVLFAIKNLGKRYLSVELIAKEMKTPIRTLERMFQQCFHLSVWEYVVAIRMRVACSLLANKQYLISEIGSIVGYADSSAFARAFKTILGLTPTDTRNYLNGDKTLDLSLPKLKPTGFYCTR